MLSAPARLHIHPAPLLQEQHTPQGIAQIARAAPVLIDHPAQNAGVDVRSGKAAAPSRVSWRYSPKSLLNQRPSSGIIIHLHLPGAKVELSQGKALGLKIDLQTLPPQQTGSYKGFL